MLNISLLSEFARILQELTGNEFPESKYYLIQDRLEQIVNDYAFDNFQVLLEELKANKNLKLKNRVISLMTTHETMFFRDHWPFEFLETYVSKHGLDYFSSSRPLKIWSAGCSFGMEAYSIAIELQKAGLSPGQYKIYGSDISDDCIKLAQDGTYSLFELSRTLSKKYIDEHFQAISNQIYRVKDKYKEALNFSQQNLLEAKHLGESFDIIFCRYVVIYFNQENRRIVLKNFINNLSTNGHLIFGSVEALGDTIENLERTDFHPSILKKVA